MSRCLLALLLLAVAAPAQNFLPNGDFEQGLTGWTNTQFNDPLGTHGVAVADVTGSGPSQALYADFQTLSPVMHCRYVSNPFFLPPTTMELMFDVMFEKQVTTPIPSPTVNRFEVTILDATSTRVFFAQVNAPNQTGLFERASFRQSFAVPAAGQYTVDVFMRHSNLANMPFIAWIDNIVVGHPTHNVFGTPCPGSGQHVPVMGATGVPDLGSSNWKITVSNALSPTAALLVLGVTNRNWSGIPLPLDIGGRCSVHVAPLIIQGVPVLGSGPGPGLGSGERDLPIPNDPALQGALIYGQWWVRDPGSASWTGLATTAGIMFRIL